MLQFSGSGAADTSLAQYGQAAAGKVLQAASAFPPNKRAAQIKRTLNSIDGALWPAVNKLVKRGADWQSALASVFAEHVVHYFVRAGGGTLSGLGAIPPSNLLTTTPMVQLQPTGLPAPGSCTSDGKYIWDAGGFWRAKKAGEQCTLITDQQSNIRTGGGGVTVTPSSSIKVGPFVFGLNRDGSATTWSYDSYDKLSAEQAQFIHDALASKPSDGAYWRPIAQWAKGDANGTWLGSQDPGMQSILVGPNARYGSDFVPGSGKPGTVVSFPGNATWQWPAAAPWGKPWLTWFDWLQKFGFAPTASYNARYIASGAPQSGNNNDPIAAFTYPVGIDQALTAMSGVSPAAAVSQLYHQQWGLYVWLQPVGGLITSSNGSAPGATPNMPLAPLQTATWQLNVTAMPLLPGASWFTELAGEFYSGVIDVAGSLSSLLCTVAQNPGAATAGAAAVGGPIAAGAAGAGVLLVQGQCNNGQAPIPQVTPPVAPASTPWGYIVAAGVAAVGVVAYLMMQPPPKKTPTPQAA